jgi:hypothetical protein
MTVTSKNDKELLSSHCAQELAAQEPWEKVDPASKRAHDVLSTENQLPIPRAEHLRVEYHSSTDLHCIQQNRLSLRHQQTKHAPPDDNVYVRSVCQMCPATTPLDACM